jgi:hypothetical protein
MSDETYPPANMSNYARRVQNAEASGIRRSWVGNTESNRNQNEKVHLSESPLRLRLTWKESPKHDAHLIGIFNLDLQRLLEAGYVRLDSKSENEIRLRFYHGWDNVIYIQANMKAPALPIGRMP